MQTDVNQLEAQSPQATSPKKSEFPAGLAVLPLRLFLGLSFVAAGIDKLTDPEFFDPNAVGYIGTQLAGFAKDSPLGGLLTNLAVPNAALFGGMVVVGELAIGIATLLGFLSRISAIFGILISLTLWLTATWTVQPFFFSSDLPYAFGWLTLAIVGATMFSVDGLIAQWRETRKAQSGEIAAPPVVTAQNTAALARRRFIVVAGATFAAGTVTAIAWGNTLVAKSSTTTAPVTSAINPTLAPAPTNTAAPANTPAPVATTAPAVVTTPAIGATTAAPTSAPTVQGTVIASVAEVPVGTAKKFTVPNTTNTALLVHLENNNFKAFSNICTHQGCEVDYNAQANLFVCPCHGARFNAADGSVSRGPTRTPLAAYEVTAQNGSILYVQK